jgi:hypothetical protein
MVDVSDERTSFVDYHGHKLQATPPRNGIGFQQALRRYGVGNAKLWRLIDEGKVRAGLGRRLTDKRHQVIVALDSLKYARGSTSTRGRKCSIAPPPPDGEPLFALCREFKIHYMTGLRWCEWPEHPALNRRLASGLGQYAHTTRSNQTRRKWGLLASRADFAACVKVLRQPLLCRIGDNPGEWISTNGVFRHDNGRLFLTDAHIGAYPDKYGFPKGKVGRAFDRDGLPRLRLTWPGKGADEAWKVWAYDEAAVTTVGEVRAGKLDGGHWLQEGDIWTDSGKLWYSSTFVARTLKKSIGQMHAFLRRSERVVRHKRVPPGNGNRGRWPVVHHEDEIRPVLGIGGGQAATESGPSKRTVEVGEAFDKMGCVRVGGRTVPVSLGTWKLLRVLAKAREEGRGAFKGEMERAGDSNPVSTLQRFAKLFPETATIQFPGGKAKGGYRLL